jgi:beta-galactosidase/beta-glucuronidase
MKKLLVPVFAIILISQCIKPDFQKADILVTGTAEPVISLNGTWKFTLNPPENFFSNEVSCSGWKDVLFPGDYTENGFVVRSDSPYIYKTSVAIPSDYAGKIIKLRFEGIRSFTRVWVNGTFVCSHPCDSTAWDCDITKYVAPGTKRWVTVELTNKCNEISSSGDDIKPETGKNIRSVSLLALPENYPQAINIQIDPNPRNKDAILKIVIVPSSGETIWAGFRMYDPKGDQVRLNDKRYVIKGDTLKISFPVKAPLKWDTDHEYLYTVITEIFNKRILTSSTKSVIEFQKEERQKRRLLFNRLRSK